MPLFANEQHTGLHALLHRPRPSNWEQFLAHPCIFLARKLYTWRQTSPAQPLTNPVSVVCVSDTHNSQPKLPDGDILIHAGDLTQSGSLQELQATVGWLRAQPHPVKIVCGRQPRPPARPELRRPKPHRECGGRARGHRLG